jgi:hypothetical protein
MIRYYQRAYNPSNFGLYIRKQDNIFCESKDVVNLRLNTKDIMINSLYVLSYLILIKISKASFSLSLIVIVWRE